MNRGMGSNMGYGKGMGHADGMEHADDMGHADGMGHAIGIGKAMGGEQVRLLLDILLFCINGIGITGAFLETLLVDWRGEFNQPLLWGGLAGLCAVSVLWWQAGGVPGDHRRGRGGQAGDGTGNRGAGKSKALLWTACRTMALLCVYAAAVFLRRETIACSVVWSFRNVLGMYGEYYGGEEALRSVEGLLQRLAVSGGGTAEARTLCLLAVLLPILMLAGFIFSRGKWQAFLAGDALWFTAACATDAFPGVSFLTLCVTGILLAAAVGEFRDSAAAWAQAAVGIIALSFLGIILVQRLVLPVIDDQYERSAGLRHEVYATLNYKWIPGLQRLFHGGTGAGVDVTGAFGRQRRASNVSSNVYRVTLDAPPRRSLYLRGFVGADYSRRQWEAEEEGVLESYYRTHGFVMYEDGRELLNINFAAAQDNAQLYMVRVEELLGPGSYSLLPYGAYVTGDFTAHSGGTVDRAGNSYYFWYLDILGVGEDGLPEQWGQIEGQYRQYAYDSFLDYPEERLPRLTQALEEAALPRGNVYSCAVAIIDFLEEHGTYQLDVEATPVGRDYVEHFLFESHEGYCAHFASAAVLMFRYCGIPARYATGYSVSPANFSKAPENLYIAELTGAQAHAWAEIYLDGVGWVPVEATPGALAFSGDNRGELLRRLGILTGDVEPIRGGAVEEDDEDEEDEELWENISLPLLPYEDEEDEGDGEEDVTGIQGADELAGLVFRLLLAAVPAGAAFAVLFGRVRRLYWLRRREKAAGREKAFLLYRNMRSALQVMGCPRRLVLTGDAFWERLKKVLPSQSREEYEAICGILELSSFGNRAPSGEELETLGSLHDDMLSRLYLRAPFYKKPVFAGLACVLPASFRTYSLKRF